MKIQIITANEQFSDDQLIKVSYFSHPLSPDDFDINIIDLSDATIWRRKDFGIGPIEIEDDLELISRMVDDSTRTRFIYVFPKDGDYRYGYGSHGYSQKCRIKEIISDNATGLYDCFPKFASSIRVMFEPTLTKIGEKEYSADFRFAYDIGTVVTKSAKSGKTTTLSVDDKYVFTTLDICESVEKLMGFINEYMVDAMPEIPEWVRDFEFGNDSEAKAVIEESNNQIAELNHKIKESEAILYENNRYKTILFANGDQLVEVVFCILEKLLNCDLSEFVDIKQEDFRVEVAGEVFIGEIKGINTNVKNENISQLDNHYQRYLDEVGEDIPPNNVHAVLIINPLRSKNITEREPVHKQQIDLAKRNGSLIIETITLLKIFEMFLNDEISTEKCVEVLSNKTGILKIEDFEIHKLN